MENQSIELSKLIEEKSELLRIMSHDISNSAALIDLSLKKVLTKELSYEESRGLIENAKKSSDRLCNILKNVQKLEVAHLKGVNIEPVDINEVFAAIKEKFKVQLEMKAIRLICHNALPFEVNASAEKSSLEASVISNLISNAIKFSNPGSTITMAAEIENDQVVLSVGDNGKGITPENRNNLFSKHLRNSTVGTNGEVGTGLGLGIVNKYVQLYEGKISVHSNYPKGTIFKIHLPVHRCKSMITKFDNGHYQEVTKEIQ